MKISIACSGLVWLLLVAAAALLFWQKRKNIVQNKI
jgi:hypothetical protein